MIDYTPAFVAAQGQEQRSFRNWKNEMSAERKRWEAEDEIKKQIKELEKQISDEEDIPVSGYAAIIKKRDRISFLKENLKLLKKQLASYDEQKSNDFYSYSSLPDFTRGSGS